MPLLTRLVVIAATATVVILEFGRRSLLRPLDVLLSASRRIAAGGAATPLGELGRTVDDMAASMERQAGEQQAGERQRSATALHESDEVLRHVIESSSDRLFLIDVTRDGGFRFAGFNDAHERRLGLASADVYGQYIEESLPKELARIDRASYQRCLAAGHTISYDETLADPAGPSHFHTTLIPVADATHRIHRIVGVAHDVTDQRRTQEQYVRQQEHLEELVKARTKELSAVTTRLQEVFASTSDGILVVDLPGRVTALNPQGGALLGVVPADVIDRSFDALLLGLNDVVHWTQGSQLLAAVENGRDHEGEFEVGSPKPKTVRWRARPTRHASGATVAATITLQDVTREREVERLKEDFVSTVSHELRTPLTAINGHLELVIDGDAGPINELQHRFLDIARVNTTRLATLINDVLDVEQMGADKIQLRHEPVDLADVITKIAETFRLEAEAKGLVFRMCAPAGLAVVGDRDRLIQVVSNLVSNAIKYTTAGEVGVVGETAGGGVDIIVSDTGPGISAADRGRLFDKFFRSDQRVVRKAGGTGLGLFIAKGIVDRHGGSIVVETTPGVGTRFRVHLPSGAAADAAGDP
jgi:PAS domain S-box-containing protein